MTYPGPERRKEAGIMQEDIAVMKVKIDVLQEGKRELTNDIKSLTTQLNSLNAQIPGLTNSINILTTQIDSHEANAGIRGEAVEKHKIQCGKISTNVHNLWVVIGFIFTIIGILIVLIFKVK